MSSTYTLKKEKIVFNLCIYNLTCSFFHMMISWLAFKECNYLILLKKNAVDFETELTSCIDTPRDMITNLESRGPRNSLGLCGWRGQENL